MRHIEEDKILQNLKELNIYGFTKVEGVLEQFEIDKLKCIIEEYYTEFNKDNQQAYGGTPKRDVNDKILYNLQNKDKYFVDILSCPIVERIAKDKLNDKFYRLLPDSEPNYTLLYYNARSSGDSLDLHIDSNIPYVGHNTTVMQFAFVLEDSDEMNGCTVVVPGSHQSGEYSDRDLKNQLPIIAKAGDFICWDSRLWHGTLPNKSNRSRWAIIATLGRWWIKPSMDITRNLPEKIYSELTDKQKLLLGYCSIPPKNEFERTNTKCGYDFIKPTVSDYYD
jgi:hypothetical protein